MTGRQSFLFVFGLTVAMLAAGPGTSITVSQISDLASAMQASDGMIIIAMPSGKLQFAVNPAAVGFLGAPNMWTNNNDFGKAVHTTPTKVGPLASIPSECAVGELYFATDRPAGKNLYGCTSANTWTFEGL